MLHLGWNASLSGSSMHKGLIASSTVAEGDDVRSPARHNLVLTRRASPVGQLLRVLEQGLKAFTVRSLRDGRRRGE